ncbi:hypothetical protein ACFSCX_25630 [Bacillus salitolerans]|uniref:Uncharacterized protein n=1 Tax=Bacillus salitolerans TaxID=1437434 RepID=A0ABW4LY68_9BACI
MIRKLNEQDHEVVFPFLSKEASFNLFILGDIEAFGYETDFQELWGQFDEEGNIQAVLLRYHETFTPYASGKIDVEGFAEIIKQRGQKKVSLSGKSSIAEQFEAVSGLNLGNKKATFFAECRTARSSHPLRRRAFI